MDISELHRERDAYYARKKAEAEVKAKTITTEEVKQAIEAVITECYLVTLLLMRLTRLSAVARVYAALWAVITKAMLLAYEEVLITA